MFFFVNIFSRLYGILASFVLFKNYFFWYILHIYSLPFSSYTFHVLVCEEINLNFKFLLIMRMTRRYMGHFKCIFCIIFWIEAAYTSSTIEGFPTIVLFVRKFLHLYDKLLLGMLSRSQTWNWLTWHFIIYDTNRNLVLVSLECNEENSLQCRNARETSIQTYPWTHNILQNL